MDEDLEKRIDEVGRDRVFSRARALGWVAGSSPPIWVWRQIVEDVANGAPYPYDPRPLHEQVLGFRLF